MSDPSVTVLSLGDLFHGRYRVIRGIQVGGMGAVYEVLDERTSIRRALKVMRSASLADAELRERFMAEMRILADIESDHVVRPLDAGVDPATEMPFLVMDLLRGEELGVMLCRRGALPRAEVLGYLTQAARALDKIHAAQIVHSDLKPENLFVTTRDDDSPCVKILDFGIARVATAGAALRATRAFGTPLYMAPEQIDARRDIDPRADLYGLGHVTYALLVGEPYWQEEVDGPEGLLGLLSWIVEGVTEPPSDRAARRGVTLPSAFDAWFLKATARSPDDRFARASEQIDALARALADEADDGAADRVGPYRLLHELGDTGPSPIWLAEEVYDGRKLRDVALKLFRLPPFIAKGSPEAARFRDEILDEARALCRVEHPNVVRFHSLYQDDARTVLGLAMEYVPGKSLDLVLGEVGRLDERSVIEVGVAVAWALSAVHGAGLVHRDIRPGNVIQRGSSYKLIGFGIVAADTAPPSPSFDHAIPTVPLAQDDALEDEDQEPLFDGTPGYLAPECLERGARRSPTTDLYALGVTLFKLLTGDLPALDAAPRLDLLAPAKTEAAAALARVVERLLDPDPRARPRHAEEVARELEQARALLSGPLPLSAPRAPARRAAGSSPAEQPELDRRPPLVGRDDEIQMLLHAAHEAAQGGVQIALVTGPMGIGRTRLLEAAIEQAGIDPDRVLRARCLPERYGALSPLLRALDERSRAGRPLRRLEDAIARALAPAAPHGRQGAPGDPLEGVEEALLRTSSAAPLALVVDDLQWGDPQTLRLLRMLVDHAGAGHGFHLLILAAARNEPNPSPALRTLLDEVRTRRREGVRHLSLRPLGDAASAALAQAVSPIAPDLERAVVRGAGGVPYFVMHALLVWRETAAIAWRDGAWHAVDARAIAEEVPGVADLVEARIAATFAPDSAPWRCALRALSAIALYGGGLSIATILRVVGDEESTEIALEALVHAGIIAVAGGQGYSFAQEMVRQAVLNLLRQRPWFFRLHRALLDAVAEGARGLEEAAFLASGYEKLGARAEARRWLEQAMRAAAESGLFAEAAELGDRLAALTPEPTARTAVELDVAEALLRAWNFKAARQRLDRLGARVLGGPRALDLRRRIAWLEAARGLRQADAGDPSLLADADAFADPVLACQARMALAGVSPEGEAMRLAGEAVARARSLGQEVEYAARSLRIELNHAASRRDLELLEEDLQRARQIAADTSSTWHAINIEGDLAVIEAELGKVDRAIERLQRLAARAEAAGIRWQTRVFAQNIAVCLHRVGRDVEAAALSGEAADLAAEAGDPVLRGQALSLRCDALRRAGDLSAALESADIAERILRDQGGKSRALLLLRRAQILSALRRLDEALRDAVDARRTAEQHGDRGVAIAALLWEKLCLAERGDLRAEELAQILEATLAEAALGNVTLRPHPRSVVTRVEGWLLGKKLP